LLKVASNFVRATPAATPLVPFVHWHTTELPQDADPAVKQFSAGKYQELLWHLLLRGHDTFFLWCPQAESAEEVRLLHQVYAASLEYREFLERGTPVTFDVPAKPGPVVSALRLGGRLLVRRTDFDAAAAPVSLRVGRRVVPVPRVEGHCQVLEE